MNPYDELRNLLLSLQQLGPSMWNQIDAGLLKIAELEKAASVLVAPPMPDWYGMDTPWPLHDVLSRLIYAAGILLDKRDYDGHGHEGIRYAQYAAKGILANLIRERSA